jgi:tetratricopeptide (TPR) repeat protein
MAEFSVLDLSEDTKADMLARAKEAVALDPSSFFAHMVVAFLYQDLRGDFDAALTHGEFSLERNSGFSQATAIVGIAKFHLGDKAEGLRLLQSAIQAVPEDPHRYRHQRELALAHFVMGETDLALGIIDKLVRRAPDLRRNHLVSIPMLWKAGQQNAARERLGEMLALEPSLSSATMRPMHMRDTAAAAEFAEGFAAAGMPE